LALKDSFENDEKALNTVGLGFYKQKGLPSLEWLIVVLASGS